MNPSETSWIDLHSHLVPGVDDGSSSVEESIAAIERLLGTGVTAIVTTPHISASLLDRPEEADRHLREIESAWGRVREAWGRDRPMPRLGQGTEVLLDLPRPDVRDPRCRIDGGRYVLVEFPHSMLPPGSEDALHHVGRQNAIPVIAHVERYNVGQVRETVWSEWSDAGAVFQVNLGSFAGRYGTWAHDTAWALLEGGWIDVLGSDYHARGSRESWKESRRFSSTMRANIWRFSTARILPGSSRGRIWSKSLRWRGSRIGLEVVCWASCGE